MHSSLRWTPLAACALACGSTVTPPERPESTATPDRRLHLLAASDGHACALVEGELACWGRNESRQASAAYTQDTAHTAAPITPVSSWTDSPVIASAKSIATGSVHSCLLTEDGEVWCWGAVQNDDRGLLRAVVGIDPESAERNVGLLHRIALPAGVTQIESSAATTCALAEGRVHCWGILPQLRCDADLGSSSSLNVLCGVRHEPMEVEALRGSTKIAVGGGAICGRTENRELVCWTERSSNRSPDTRRVADVDEGCAATLGREIALCVRRGTELRCSKGDDALPPLTSVASFACGAGVCAITTDGNVVCTDDGQRWEAIPLLRDAESVTVADGFACARTHAGEVACWGSDRVGGLGRNARVRREPSLDGERLHPNQDEMCTVAFGPRGSPTITCVGRTTSLTPQWEWREDRELGFIYETECALARGRHEVTCTFARRPPLTLTLPEENIYDAHLLQDGPRLCVQPAAGRVRCLDANRPEPAWLDVEGFEAQATDLIADHRGVCFRKTGGEVWCRNNAHRDVPATSGSVEGISALALEAGLDQRCALLDDGRVTCWSAEDARGAERTLVELGFRAVELVSAPGRFCARSEREVTCWGRGEVGELNGVPRFSDDNLVRVEGVPPFRQLAASQHLTCGLTEEGRAWCWGPRAGAPWSGNPVAVTLRP
ncbi:MAG: RCC1 domain-containing protein [Myxococcota bacterium]